MEYVMLIEIPDPDVLLGLVAAFLIGLGGLYVFYKVMPLVKSKGDADPSRSERLEYYERQLIDMKIRLDALEMQGVEQRTEDPNVELRRFMEKLAAGQVQDVPAPEISKVPETKDRQASVPKVAGPEYANPTDYVLHLITSKNMTSRDIQVTLKKTREHTSRLLKKLFEEGYVQRNTESKPYTYSITDKGKAKIGGLQASPQTV